MLVLPVEAAARLLGGTGGTRGGGEWGAVLTTTRESTLEELWGREGREGNTSSLHGLSYMYNVLIATVHV